MNRLEQLSFVELFDKADSHKYKTIDDIIIREKFILGELRTAKNFDSIKLNCELLALQYLRDAIK